MDATMQLFVIASLLSVAAVDAFVPRTNHVERRSLVSLAATSSRKPAGSNSQYIRLSSRAVRGSRRLFQIETAVSRFERQLPSGEHQVVDLHAQLHYGTEDYFKHYGSKQFANEYDSVLYELLVDEDLMVEDAGKRRLKTVPDGQRVMMASPSDQQTARQYGLQCQVDMMDYALPNWIHADLTRQEMLAAIEGDKGQRSAENSVEPLWALASSEPSWPGAEAVSALLRPSTPSTSLSSPVARRLFSNLFLPGNTLAGVFRSIFWLLLPSPELSVMLLDWSSIIPRPTGGVSQVASPVLETLLTGNIQEARQLVFGQMIASGQRAGAKDEILVKRRNDHALKVLEKCLSSSGTGDPSKLALLYGGMHCADLEQKLTNLGFIRATKSWRTAWSVAVPTFGTSTIGEEQQPFAAVVSPAALGIGLVLLPAYLAIGGLDWIGMLDGTSEAIQDGNGLEAVANVTLYLFRHVILYLSLAKFVVEWDGGSNVFGGED